MDLTPAEEQLIRDQREARKLNAAGAYGPTAKLGQPEASLLEQLADLNEARLAMGYGRMPSGIDFGRTALFILQNDYCTRRILEIDGGLRL
jgi:hypothetical protein